MTRVNQSAMKAWRDGETIRAAEYNQERNIIIEGHNETDDRVREFMAGIGTSKLLDNAVTTPKIADGAITAAKIANDSITSAQIAPNAVNTGEIQDGCIVPSKLARASVITEKIVDGNVTTEKLAPYSVTGNKLANSAVNTMVLADTAVTTPKIGDGMVTTPKIADAAIGAGKLMDNAVTTPKVADGAITAAKIAAGSVNATNLAAGAVTPTKIVKESVTQFTYDQATIDQKLLDVVDGNIPQEVIDEIAAQASASVVTHANNQEIHVTAQKQADWNAKETTAGAQAKADAALSAAKLDAQTKANIAGNNAINASISRTTNLVVGDWNAYKANGIFEGTQMVNAPLSSDGWFRVFVMNHSYDPTNYCTQTAFDFTNGAMYTRTTNAGVWTPWRRILNQNDYDVLFGIVSNGKVAIANAITGKGIPASPAETHGELASKILQINTGIQYASGTGTINATYQASVDGLPFAPRKVYIAANPMAGNSVTYEMNGFAFYTTNPTMPTSETSRLYSPSGATSLMVCNFRVGGFTASAFQANTSFTWWAYAG